MNKLFTTILCSLFSFYAISQSSITGSVIDTKTKLPLEGATVTLTGKNVSIATDAFGRFILTGKYDAAQSITITDIGYKQQLVTAGQLINNKIILMEPMQVILQDVTVTANAGDLYKPVAKADIAMRGITNSQEILRIIPGVIIGQHQGGGKAEQIFLRGFDADHGTDLRLDVDGMPINMASHAHGQGFADSHFIIPETIENVDYKKGPYTASKGDYATTGFVDYNTKKTLLNNMIKLEGGMFDTYRAVGMVNLLGKGMREKGQSWYAASEYRYSNSFFDAPQHFNRFNFFTKYNGKIGANSMLTISASAFWSKWDASGQIPDRAVDQHIIGFYGAIDPNEGGITNRTSGNAQLTTSLKHGGIIKNQIYYSKSYFKLHTNFTFFLEDSVNGDQIRQRENREMMGYNGRYNKVWYAGNVKIMSEAGLNIRYDKTKNSELSHTSNRNEILNYIKLGDIGELDIAPYVSETFSFGKHFSINAGLRFDQFYYQYKNKLASDSTLPGIGTYKANNNIVSPKLNFYYHLNEKTQFYLLAGRGFHSNDARGVVVEKGRQTLPEAYGADLGTVFKPAKNIVINVALWYIYLQQEFVYSGDGGFVEFSGKTRRIGFDFTGRYQPLKSLYFDVDVNYAHGRSINDPKGENYIPLAPVWTSTAGLTYTNKYGLNGSLRYRYVGSRAGNEDYSLTAKGYFITDAVINYTKRRYEIGLVVNNVLNRKWKETQFATETRLKGETSPVDEICFTPGTPLAATLSLSWFFR